MTETTATAKEHINASEIDPKFKHELSRMHGGEKLFRCFQLGACAPDYPVAQLGLKEPAFNKLKVNNSKTLKQASEGVKLNE